MIEAKSLREMTEVELDIPTGELGNVDWKAKPLVVLEEVNALLAEHGLELVMRPCEGDDYKFLVAKV